MIINESEMNKYKSLLPQHKPAFIVGYLLGFIRENINDLDEDVIEGLLSLTEMIMGDYTSAPLLSEFEKEIIKIMREREEKEENS